MHYNDLNACRSNSPDSVFGGLVLSDESIQPFESKEDADKWSRLVEPELAGVLNWSLASLVRLVKRGCFPPEPPAMRREKRQAENESDTVQYLVRSREVTCDWSISTSARFSDSNQASFASASQT